MRATVLVLSIATLTFAGTTAYFARELAALRSQRAVPVAAAQGNTAAPASASLAAPGKSIAAAAATPSPDTLTFDTVMTNVGVATPLTEVDIRRMQAEHNRQFLARLGEPQGREEMRAEHRIMFRNMYPGVDKFLGLSAEQLSQFMDLMADQQIGAQEKHARCMLDPDCSPQNAYAGENHALEISAFLGPDRSQKFETYKNTMGEREAISQLRNRLSDNSRLSDDTAERLVTALAEERAAMHRESAASGSGMHSFGMGAGTLFAPAEGSFESRYEAARQNSQRLRDRAAQHLNAEQMRTFNEMQDELLVGLRGLLRQKPGSFSAMSIAMPSGAVATEALIVGETAEQRD
jgi:hypothetical protein